jgi:hypothetical protein
MAREDQFGVCFRSIEKINIAALEQDTEPYCTAPTTNTGYWKKNAFLQVSPISSLR